MNEETNVVGTEAPTGGESAPAGGVDLAREEALKREEEGAEPEATATPAGVEQEKPADEEVAQETPATPETGTDDVPDGETVTSEAQTAPEATSQVSDQTQETPAGVEQSDTAQV